VHPVQQIVMAIKYRVHDRATVARVRQFDQSTRRHRVTFSRQCRHNPLRIAWAAGIGLESA
jgi:hypothetical protein